MLKEWEIEAGGGDMKDMDGKDGCTEVKVGSGVLG